MINVIINSSAKKIYDAEFKCYQLDTEAIFYIPFNYDVSHQVFLLHDI